MVSTAKISEYLEGINFPATKQEMIQHAQQKDAPQDVMQMLHELPDRHYDSMAGVWHAVGQKE